MWRIAGDSQSRPYTHHLLSANSVPGELLCCARRDPWKW